jgi:hypothetical protein
MKETILRRLMNGLLIIILTVKTEHNSVLSLIRSMVLGLYGYDIGEGQSFLSRLKDYL